MWIKLASRRVHQQDEWDVGTILGIQQTQQLTETAERRQAADKSRRCDCAMQERQERGRATVRQAFLDIAHRMLSNGKFRVRVPVNLWAYAHLM